MAGEDEPKPDPELDETGDHEPTEAEMDERVSLHPMTAEEVLRALVRAPSRAKKG